MKVQSLQVSALLAVTLLTPYAVAGPLVAFILPFIPSLGPIFGAVPAATALGWVVVNKGLYIASSVVVGEMIAGTIIGGAVGGVSASNAEESKALAVAISEASVSSASHESLSRATVSSLQAEWTQNSIALQSSSAAAVASVNELFKAPGTAPVDTALDPFTFKKRWVTETTIPTVTSAPSAALLDRRGDELPLPPVAPVSTVPADFVPPTYAGVPEYNIHMCKVDIVAMGTAGQSLVMNNPADRVLRVDNVPSTCMVLANFIMGNPTLAPFAIPMGTASLQWNDVDPAAIGKVREFFGVQ